MERSDQAEEPKDGPSEEEWELVETRTLSREETQRLLNEVFAKLATRKESRKKVRSLKEAEGKHLTVDEFADYFGITRSTVYKIMNAGLLHWASIPTGERQEKMPRRIAWADLKVFEERIRKGGWKIPSGEVDGSEVDSDE